MAEPATRMMNSQAAVPSVTEPSEIPQDRVLPGGWYTLGAVLAVTAFAYADRYLITLAAAPIAISLELTDAQLGAVQGLAFAVFTVLAVYPIAWAADRFDRRYVLGACVVIWSIGAAAIGLAHNFIELFAAAVAIAAGEAALVPLTMSIVPDLFKGRKRVLANGIQYFCTILSLSLALVLGGLALGALTAAHPHLPAVLRQWEPWRLAFFLVVSPTPLFLIAIAFARLRHARPQLAVGGAEGPAEAKMLPFMRAHWKPVTMVLSSLALFTLAYGGFVIWLPVVAARLFGATPAQNGLSSGAAVGIATVCGVPISTFLLRRLMPRLGRRASARLAWRIMLVSTPIILAFPFVASVLQVYVLWGIFGIAGTATGVLVPTILQDMAPAAMRARFLAIYTIASALCSGAAPSLVGLVSDRLGGDRGLLYALIIVALPAWIAGTLLMHLGEARFAVLADDVARADRQ
jgi:MFS family permease